MITCALIAAHVTTGARIVTETRHGEERVAIQGLLRTSDFGAIDRDAAEVLAHTLLERNADISKGRMLLITEGRPPTVAVTTMGLRFGVNVPKTRLREGLRLLASIVSHPLYDDELWEHERSALAARTLPAWERASDGHSHGYPKWPHQKVEFLAKRLLRPERLILSVLGDVSRGDVDAAWAQVEAGWTPGPEPKGYFDITVSPAADVGNVLVWRGATFKPTDSAKWLAAFALGVGKEGSLFRCVREGLGLTYRQEAAVELTPSGPQLRLMLVSTQDLNRDVVFDTLRRDIDAWDERTALRAVGMAKGCWQYGAPWNPISFGRSNGTNSFDDDAFLQACWQSLTNAPWSTTAMLTSLAAVSVVDLRAAAKAILTNADVRQTR